MDDFGIVTFHRILVPVAVCKRDRICRNLCHKNGMRIIPVTDHIPGFYFWQVRMARPGSWCTSEHIITEFFWKSHTLDRIRKTVTAALPLISLCQTIAMMYPSSHPGYLQNSLSGSSIFRLEIFSEAAWSSALNFRLYLLLLPLSVYLPQPAWTQAGRP